MLNVRKTLNLKRTRILHITQSITNGCTSKRMRIIAVMMSELRGIVLRLKRMDSRIEPCGTPKVRGDEGERCGGMTTADMSEDK